LSDDQRRYHSYRNRGRHDGDRHGDGNDSVHDRRYRDHRRDHEHAERNRNRVDSGRVELGVYSKYDCEYDRRNRNDGELSAPISEVTMDSFRRGQHRGDFFASFVPAV
jgi:hypothetical protein